MADFFEDQNNMDEDDDIITLYNEERDVDEDFYHLATLDVDDKWFVVLKPVEKLPDIEEDEVLIYEVQEGDDGRCHRGRGSSAKGVRRVHEGNGSSRRRNGRELTPARDRRAPLGRVFFTENGDAVFVEKQVGAEPLAPQSKRSSDDVAGGTAPIVYISAGFDRAKAPKRIALRHVRILPARRLPRAPHKISQKGRNFLSKACKKKLYII